MEHSRATLMGGVLLAILLVVVATAAAAPTATKQRISIETEKAPFNTMGPFTIFPRGPGKMKLDSGEWTGTGAGTSSRGTRDGQDFEAIRTTDKLVGKFGTLFIRLAGRIYSAGNNTHAGVGTWTLVKGTGRYAGLKGGGRYAHVIDQEDKEYLRYDGFVTTR